MNNEKMLKSILHTVQMGQTGIRVVQNKAVSPALKQELKRQLKCYDSMEHTVKQLAAEHHFQVPDIPKSVTAMSDMMAKMRLIGGERDSKIAGMLIQGNTRGMILGMKNLRKSKKVSPEIQHMAQSLINEERDGIERTQNFL